jgi:hypothetical protein
MYMKKEATHEYGDTFRGKEAIAQPRKHGIEGRTSATSDIFFSSYRDFE